MEFLLLLLSLVVDIRCIHGGIPISTPFTDDTTHTLSYNLIDVFPSCYARGLCPAFHPGGPLSAFPNGEEKYQMVMHNMFRMFANSTLSIPHAKYKYAGNDLKDTELCPAWDAEPIPKPDLTRAEIEALYPCTICGTWSEYREPLYWYSDANQAARFKQWDENSCNQSWYDVDGNGAHDTCKWVLPEYHTINGESRPEYANHCLLFGGVDDCAFDQRSSDFCVEDSCWFETEGICGMNTCVTDPHCEPIYATAYKLEGAGFIEGMNGAATQYVQLTDNSHQLLYPLPSAAHFDERYKLGENDLNADGNFFSLILYYFDDYQTDTAGTCYALYDGEYHEMNVLISSFEFSSTSFSSNSYNVMFTTNHAPPTQCEPYAFLCRTSNDQFVRLPEDESYFFGTDWIDWKWSNYSSFGYDCKEQHYYYHEGRSRWLANSGYRTKGGEEMDIDDIWYYNEYGATCEGCSKITSLQCVETCIRSGFTECEVDGVQCNSAVGPSDEDFDSDTITTTEGTEKPKSEKKKQMSGGAIAAIVLIILLFICFTAAYLYYRKAHQLTPCPTKLECIECCSHCKQMRYSKPAVQVEEAKVNNTHTLGLPRPGKRGELVPNISASADASADGNA